jgi:ABC-type phosphate transport system substrate-binding protein
MSYYLGARRGKRAVFWKFFAGILSLVLLPASFFPSGLAAEGDIAVVVRPDLPVDDLTLPQTRKLLLGEQQFWNSNLRVTLLLRAPAAREREVVLKVIYRMNEAEFRQYWISKMFRAESTSGPKVVYSNEMATELVSALPGSVAFVDATQVPKGLKILKIDGKLPGQTGYPLK